MAEPPESSSARPSSDLPLCPVCGLLLTSATEETCPSCGASLTPYVGEAAVLADTSSEEPVEVNYDAMLATEAPATPPHIPRWKWALLMIDAALLVVCLALTAVNLLPIATQAAANTPATATSTSGVSNNATSQPALQATVPGVTPTSIATTASATKTGGAQPTPTATRSATATPTHTPPSPTPDPTPPGTGG